MKSEFIGTYSVPDGYFGHRITARVVLVGKRLVHVFPFGFHTSHIFPCDFSSADEAIWHINNHPEGKQYFEGMS